jgi:hypothetical protein
LAALSLALVFLGGDANFSATFPQTAAGTYGAQIDAEDAVRRGTQAFNRKDYGKALSWFLKGADAGNADAQANLGRMYYDGLGVPQDFAQSFNWYRKAGEQGHPIGEELVGNMYRKGKGVTTDYRAAVMWLERAAEHGSSSAKIGLSAMYLSGEGVPKDVGKGIAWMENVADKSGNPGQKASIKPDLTLWCDLPLLNGRTVRALVSIDTEARYLKIEEASQGTYQYRDGYFGKVITSGFMAGEAINVQQFVTIANGNVRFGNTKNGALEVNSIDLNTGIFRTGGRITQCTEAKARR